MDDWTCYILNTYLRYFDLRKIDTIIKSVEASLQNRKIVSISDIFFVAGDFSSTTYEPIQYFKPIDKIPDREPVNIDLDDIGFYRVIDSYSTSFSRDLPLNKLDVISSCNILCREKMPVTRNAFREALYKTKSPLSIHNLNQVPSGKSDKLCGYYGVVRQGMCHMAIPRGWTWGGPASVHCPVWIEVYKRKNRLTSTLHQSLDNDDETSASAVNHHQMVRRNSFNSNMSYKRLNGHGNVSGLNESSDSVFEK